MCQVCAVSRSAFVNCSLTHVVTRLFTFQLTLGQHLRSMTNEAQPLSPWSLEFPSVVPNMLSPSTNSLPHGTHTHVHTHTQLHICSHAPTQPPHSYTHVCTCMHTCAHMCMHMQAHTEAHRYTHAQTHACTHTRTAQTQSSAGGGGCRVWVPWLWGCREGSVLLLEAKPEVIPTITSPGATHNHDFLSGCKSSLWLR